MFGNKGEGLLHACISSTLKYFHMHLLLIFVISKTTNESDNQLKNTGFFAETVFIYDFVHRYGAPTEGAPYEGSTELIIFDWIVKLFLGTLDKVNYTYESTYF